MFLNCMVLIPDGNHLGYEHEHSFTFTPRVGFSFFNIILHTYNASYPGVIMPISRNVLASR